MIEIKNENQLMAEKIFNEANDEVRSNLIRLLANESPAECLTAVTKVMENDFKRTAAIMDLATGKYKV